MHSTLVRIQNVFGYFTTVAFFVALFTALSVVLFPANPTADIQVRNVKVSKGRQQQQYYYTAKQQEYAFINFDLDADLTSLFNWNTKQVFVYLSVAYGGAKGSKYAENEAVIWDTILPSRSAASLHLVNERAKYNVADISGKFLDRNATMHFYWNVQPHVGALTWGTVDFDAAAAAASDEAAVAEEGKSGKQGWKFAFPPVKTAPKKTDKKAATAASS